MPLLFFDVVVHKLDRSSQYFCGEGKERSSVPSPLVLLCGPEGAKKTGTEGLSLRAAEPVRMGRTGVEGFRASVGAWDSSCLQKNILDFTFRSP